MIIVKNQKKLNKKYIFDKFGNMIKRIWSDGDISTGYYDKFGNMIKLIDTNGVIYIYSFNQFGECLSINKYY